MIPDFRFSYQQINCNGTEESLDQCNHNEWIDCGADEAAGTKLDRFTF